METRRLGRTGHDSTVINFGAFAIGSLSQDEADRTIEYALEHGINHFDVAPTYADAELRLGDYLRRHPLPDVFISCKTQERKRQQATEQLYRTLDRLHRDAFDLYQFHAVCNQQDLDDVLAPGGSAEAVDAARNEGIVSHIGITGHGLEAPAIHAKATEHLDLSTVMTACNPFLYTIPQFRTDWDALMQVTQERDLGVQVLKAGAKASWGDRERTFNTWYEPLTEQVAVDRSVAWVLKSQPVTTLCSSGDVAILKLMVEAAERYREMPEMSPEDIVAAAPGYGNIFEAA